MMLVGMFMGLLGMLAILSLSNFLIIFLLNLFVLSYLFLKLFGSILGFVYLPFLFSLLVLFLLWCLFVGRSNRRRRLNLILSVIVHLWSHFIFLARLNMRHDYFRGVVVNLRDNLDCSLNRLRSRSLYHLLDGLRLELGSHLGNSLHWDRSCLDLSLLDNRCLDNWLLHQLDWLGLGLHGNCLHLS